MRDDRLEPIVPTTAARGVLGQRLLRPYRRVIGSLQIADSRFDYHVRQRLRRPAASVHVIVNLKSEICNDPITLRQRSSPSATSEIRMGVTTEEEVERVLGAPDGARASAAERDGREAG